MSKSDDLVALKLATRREQLKWQTGFSVGYNAGLRKAAAIANDPKWHTDPRAIMSDIPKSIAMQILEEVVEE